MSTYLKWLFESAFSLNKTNILRLVAERSAPDVLDLGCDDGAWTMHVAGAARATRVTGVEIVPARASQARSRGIDVHEADLSRSLPFANESFDLVHANQVIEHVPDVDLFTSEAYRVLKPGGRIVFSTENGSSWHNVFAAALGWQIFSLTNVSNRAAGLGNPLSLMRGLNVPFASWTHKVIFNYRGLPPLAGRAGTP